jgi:hypothetical protein
MWLCRPPTRLVLEVRVPPGEVERRLRAITAVVPSVLLSPTWGRSEELVGQIQPGGFKLRVRHGYSNGLTRLLYGTVSPVDSGTRIAGEFRSLLWVVLILRCAGLFILASVFFYLRLFARSGTLHGLALLPLAAPVLTLSLLVGIETLARRMGDADEARMRSRFRESFTDVAVGHGPRHAPGHGHGNGGDR